MIQLGGFALGGGNEPGGTGKGLADAVRQG